MKPLYYAPAAVEDIRQILEYTREHWGDKQLDMYAQILSNTFNALQTNDTIPLLRQRDELCPGCKSIVSGQHVIYIRYADTRIEIIRVLHKRMDPFAHIHNVEG